MQKLILASKSPYRKELLSRLGIDFECANSDFDESELKGQIQDPTKLTQKLSLAKAQAVQKDNPTAFIIGSDQVCYFKNTVLGKTGCLEKSFEQLKEMQGRSHELITSYTILTPQKTITKTNITRLTMRALSENQIRTYLETDSPIDCAGSYKLELGGIALMSSIETSDYTAIIGLPLTELATDLSVLGILVHQGKKQ